MKKLLALILALVMSLSLVACGGGSQPAAEKPAEIEPLHFFDAGYARGKWNGGHPVASGERDPGDGVFDVLPAAKGGDIVAVCQSLAEADKVGLEAEIVV